MEHSDIIEGMATIFWASAWSDHVEEKGCQSLSGCRIEDEMPPIPEEAYAVAYRSAGKIEQANATNLESLYAKAMKADGVIWPTSDVDPPKGYYDLRKRFGECLAWGVRGSGFSWEDDHEAFPLKIPHDGGECDLMFLAEEGCEECISLGLVGDDEDDDFTVICTICKKPVPAQTAHAHQGEFVCDETCWDERLRSSE